MGRMPAGVHSHRSRENIGELWADETGFLLVDLLFSIALGLAVMAMAVNMMVVMQASSRQQSVDAELMYSARVVQEVIQSKVRTALDMEIVDGGSVLRINDPRDGVTSYYSANGNLYRYHKTSNPIAENVQSIHFTKSEGCLLVDLDLQREQESMGISFVCAIRCE